MAEDDTQFRDFIGKAHGGIHQVEARIGHLQREARLRKYFHIGDEVRAVDCSDQTIAFPDIAVSDPEKQFIAMVPFEVLAKLRFCRIQIANHADDDRLIFDNLQDPQIVLDPRAGFDLDPASNAKGSYVLAILRRQRLRRIRDLWIRHALRTSRIVKMEVRVDDRDGFSVRSGRICRRHCGSRGKKPPAAVGSVRISMVTHWK